MHTVVWGCIDRQDKLIDLQNNQTCVVFQSIGINCWNVIVRQYSAWGLRVTYSTYPTGGRLLTESPPLAALLLANQESLSDQHCYNWCLWIHTYRHCRPVLWLLATLSTAPSGRIGSASSLNTSRIHGQLHCRKECLAIHLWQETAARQPTN